MATALILHNDLVTVAGIAATLTCSVTITGAGRSSTARSAAVTVPP